MYSGAHCCAVGCYSLHTITPTVPEHKRAFWISCRC
uniref:Uncharacterized protein n=1 Tax=Pseudomonas phage BL5 TaxID=3109218 RepID=A0AAU7B926_9VIRU